MVRDRIRMIGTNSLTPIPPKLPKVLYSSYQDIQAYLIASKDSNYTFVYYYKSGEYIDRCQLWITDIRSFKVVKTPKTNKVTIVFIALQDVYIVSYRLATPKVAAMCLPRVTFSLSNDAAVSVGNEYNL